MSRAAPPAPPDAAGREVGIRRARAADGSALDALWREVDELHARLVPGFFRRAAGPAPARGRSFLEQALGAPDQALFVADLDGAVCGLCHVQLYDTPASPTLVPLRRAHIEDLVVEASRRRQGLGRRLLAAAGAWAHSRGAAELVLTVWQGNGDALRFYEALGYRTVSSVLARTLEGAPPGAALGPAPGRRPRRG